MPTADPPEAERLRTAGGEVSFESFPFVLGSSLYSSAAYSSVSGCKNNTH